MEARSTVLSIKQQAALDKKKVELRMANERYLRDHPEVNQLMKGFMLKVLDDKPDDVLPYAVDYFTSDDGGDDDGRE
jgi:hypothetical protein